MKLTRNELTYWIVESIPYKAAEVMAGKIDIGEYLDALLFGLYVLDKIIHDKTLLENVRSHAKNDIETHVIGFPYAYMSGSDEYDFDVDTIEEKIIFMMLYNDVDMGVIGNVKKRLIEDDIRKWFKDVYMEVKWDDSDEFIWLLTLLSHVPDFADLPLEDLRDVFITQRVRKHKSKPDWGLYWLTGDREYLLDEDFMNYKAWIFWRSEY